MTLLGENEGDTRRERGGLRVCGHQLGERKRKEGQENLGKLHTSTFLAIRDI
jgi:hypothetical protein